jgi:hypothetical protein
MSTKDELLEIVRESCQDWKHGSPILYEDYADRNQRQPIKFITIGYRNDDRIEFYYNIYGSGSYRDITSPEEIPEAVRDMLRWER